MKPGVHPSGGTPAVIPAALDHERLTFKYQGREFRRTDVQGELVHVSRLTALGEMASAMAHELNQPLTAAANFMKGCLILLKRKVRKPEMNS